MNPTWNDRLWVKEIRDEKTVQRCLVDALRYCDRQLVLGGGCYSGGIDVGPIVRGREDLQSYYAKRFASGARGHAIKVVEVHVQGDGGYGLAQFSVTVPLATGGTHEVHGSIVTIYQRDPDGWHMRLVEPSVPEPPAK